MKRHFFLSLILCTTLAASAADTTPIFSPAPPVTQPAATAPAVQTPAVTAAAPADQLHDPATSPLEAWDDLKAARKVGWPLALLAAAIMLARGLGTVGRNVAWLAWLNKGRAAVILGSIWRTLPLCP